MESWKPVIGYEGLYEVSDLGHVRRCARVLKMSAADVAKAREMRASGVTYRAIAETFGVTKHAVIVALSYQPKRSAFRDNEKLVLAPHHNRTGYLMVTLCRDGKTKAHAIHRLVMSAFVGPVPDDKEVNHKNGIRHDPRLDNLEYITHAENILHAHRVLGKKGGVVRGEKNHNSKLTEDIVKEIRALASQGVFYRVIAAQFGICRDTVIKVVNRKYWKHVA